MGKIFGILLVVVGIWVGLEVYQNGTQGAFGGLLAGGGSSPTLEERATVPQRAGAAVQHAYDDADARRSRMLGE